MNLHLATSKSWRERQNEFCFPRSRFDKQHHFSLKLPSDSAYNPHNLTTESYWAICSSLGMLERLHLGRLGLASSRHWLRANPNLTSAPVCRRTGLQRRNKSDQQDHKTGGTSHNQAEKRGSLPVVKEQSSSGAITSRGRSQSATPSPYVHPNDEQYNFIDSPFFDSNLSTSAEVELSIDRRVTAADLARRFTKPPRSVHMLLRDFIHDSSVHFYCHLCWTELKASRLYNPHYGYFSKQATIFDSPARIDISALNDLDHFETEIARVYKDLYSRRDPAGPGVQVWHTPSELFKVSFYGSIAISQFKHSYSPGMVEQSPGSWLRNSSVLATQAVPFAFLRSEQAMARSWSIFWTTFMPKKRLCTKR